MTGQQLRDTTLSAQERRHGDWMASVRAEAIRIAYERGTVSADDIAYIPLPEGASPNVRGGVFNHPLFEFSGFVRSKRPEAHFNRLNEYRLSRAGWGRVGLKIDEASDG